MATSQIVYDTNFADNRVLLVAKLKTIPGNIRDPFAMMRYLSTNPHLEKVIRPNLPDRFTPLCTLSVWCKTFGLDFNLARDALYRRKMVEGVGTFKAIIQDLMTYAV